MKGKNIVFLIIFFNIFYLSSDFIPKSYSQCSDDKKTDPTILTRIINYISHSIFGKIEIEQIELGTIEHKDDEDDKDDEELPNKGIYLILKNEDYPYKIKNFQDLKNLEIELTNGKPIKFEPINEGVSKGKYLITLDNGRKGVFKIANGSTWGKNDYKNERAAYILDQKLGFALVPPTVIRKMIISKKEYEGSMQLFMENAQTANQAQHGRNKSEELVLLDYLMFNADRHRSNFMFARKFEEVEIAIDNGLAFNLEYSNYKNNIRIIYPPETILNQLLRFSKDDLKELLSHYLGKPELQEFEKRYDRLKKNSKLYNLKDPQPPFKNIEIAYQGNKTIDGFKIFPHSSFILDRNNNVHTVSESGVIQKINIKIEKPVVHGNIIYDKKTKHIYAIDENGNLYDNGPLELKKNTLFKNNTVWGGNFILNYDNNKIHSFNTKGAKIDTDMIGLSDRFETGGTFFIDKKTHELNSVSRRGTIILKVGTANHKKILNASNFLIEKSHNFIFSIDGFGTFSGTNMQAGKNFKYGGNLIIDKKTKKIFLVMANGILIDTLEKISNGVEKYKIGNNFILTRGKNQKNWNIFTFNMNTGKLLKTNWIAQDH